MGESWETISQVVAGRIFKSKTAIGAVAPEWFCDPYDRAVKLIKEGHSPDEVMQTIGAYPYSEAVQAYENTKEIQSDWVAILEEVAAKAVLADDLEYAVKKLRRGDSVEMEQIFVRYKALDRKKPYMPTLQEITAEENPFIPSGWSAIDSHVVGWPKAGLITVGASPGTGKTSFAVRAAHQFVKEHRKKAGIFSLEMSGAELKERIVELCPDLTPREMGLMVVEDGAGLSVEKIAARAMREPDLAFMAVDFADLMIQDENNESEMAKIYRTLALVAKEMQIPVILLAQLNRAYIGGVPLTRHLRYTSLAEALSWMIFMLYNPSKDFNSAKPELTLPNTPGVSYAVVWKVRGGYRKHPEDNPGAIAIPWQGSTGWGEFAAAGQSWRKLQFGS